MKKLVAYCAGNALLLLALPGVCLAFSGKVTYPDGKPATGAVVNVFLNDTGSMAAKASAAPVMTIPPGAMPIGAALPQAGAAPRAKTVATCDSSGRFTVSNDLTSDAMVQIKAPDGRESATVTLPAKLFGKGETVIILPSK